MSFKNVIGQEEAIGILTSYISGSRLPHALIFSGPEGVGKSLVAKELAKALNCEKDGIDPCDECSTCRRIDSLNHPDVSWVKPVGGSIKIEQIRSLRSQISLRPYEARYKVYIIDNAEAMTEEAQNAFLKTLEEPPPRSYLILISSKPQSLLPTISSRCQVLRFRTLNFERIKDALISRYSLDSAKAHFLAYLSGGRLGEAIGRMHDDILVKKNRVVDEAHSILSKGESIGWQNEPKEEIVGRLEILIDWYRDLLLLGEGESVPLINVDRREDLIGLKDGYLAEVLITNIYELNRAKELILANVNPKIALELMTQKMRKRCLR